MIRITMWQRAVLMYMNTEGQRLQELHVGSTHRVEATFSRRAIETALWFDWQGHHTRKISQLIEQGWIFCRFDARNIIHYELTRSAEVNINSTLAQARPYVHVLYTSEDMFKKS